jgi:hypothetical protein
MGHFAPNFWTLVTWHFFARAGILFVRQLMARFFRQSICLVLSITLGSAPAVPAANSQGPEHYASARSLRSNFAAPFLFADQALTIALKFAPLRSFLPGDSKLKHQVGASWVTTMPSDPQLGPTLPFNPAELVSHHDPDFSDGFMMLDPAASITDSAMADKDSWRWQTDIRGQADTELGRRFREWILSLNEPDTPYDGSHAFREIIHGIQNAYRTPEFNMAPLILVSRDPTLEKSRLAMVEIFQEARPRPIIVLNSRWVREELEIQKDADPALRRVSTWRLGLCLNHASFHIWLKKRSEIDIVVTETKTLDSFLLGPEGVVMDEAHRQRPISSIQFEHLYGPEGAYRRACRIPLDASVRAYDLKFVRHLDRDEGEAQREALLRELIRTMPPESRVPTGPIPSLPAPLSLYAENALKKSYIPRPHGILKRLIRVEPVIELNPGVNWEPDETKTLVEFAHAHVLAAFEAWRYHAAKFPLSQFATKMATDVFTRWLNTQYVTLTAQAGTDARHGIAQVKGRYGLMAVLGDTAGASLFAGVPISVRERLQRSFYLACASIGSYAMTEAYRRRKREMPTLRLPDHLLVLSVTGPKGSGVSAALPPETWVSENLRRTAAATGKPVASLHVGGLVIRQRHLQMINDTLKELGISLRQIPEDLEPYFRGRPDGNAELTDIVSLRKHVKERMGGRVVLSNDQGGSLGLISDSFLMARFAHIPFLGQPAQADIEYGAGRAVEVIVGARAAYHAIDFSGVVVSGLATEEGNPKILQAIDPRARDLRNGVTLKESLVDEIALAREAGLPLEEYVPGWRPRLQWLALRLKRAQVRQRVPTLFDLDALTGGPCNLVIATTPLGEPDTHASYYVPGFSEIEVRNGGREIRSKVLVVEPAGRVRLIPLVYDTGLTDLETKLALAKNPTAQARIHLDVGRLYGDLRLYDQAFDCFARAEELIRHDAQRRQREGLAAYFTGLQNLLGETPNREEALANFSNAESKDYRYGALMEGTLTKLEKSLPRLVMGNELDMFMDYLAHGVGPTTFDDIVRRIADGYREEWPTVRRMLSNMILANACRARPETMIRLLQAALSNPRYGDSVSEMLFDFISIQDMDSAVVRIIRHALRGRRRLLGDRVGVGVRVGGDAVYLELVDAGGSTNDPANSRRLSRQEIPLDPSADPNELTDLLAGKTVEWLHDRGIDPGDVRRLGVSFDGFVAKKTGAVTGMNFGVRFDAYPLAQKLEMAFKRLDLGLGAIKVETLSTGKASAMGEFRDGRGWLQRGNGIFLNWGLRSFSAYRLRDGKLSTDFPQVIEHQFFRHPGRYNDEGHEIHEYYFTTMEELQKRGLARGQVFLDNPLVSHDSPSSRLNGVWLAIRMFDFLIIQFMKELKGVLSLEEFQNMMDINKHKVPMAEWGEKVSQEAVRKLLEVKNCKGFFEIQVKTYKDLILEELGAFLYALHVQFPNEKIVLGGGLTDAWKWDFLETPNTNQLIEALFPTRKTDWAQSYLKDRILKKLTSPSPIKPILLSLIGDEHLWASAFAPQKTNGDEDDPRIRRAG